jgi:hypothetical protein
MHKPQDMRIVQSISLYVLPGWLACTAATASKGRVKYVPLVTASHQGGGGTAAAAAGVLES